VIGLQNPSEVKVNYILASSTLPLATVLAITFVIGLLIGCLICTASFSKLKWQYYLLNKKDKAITEQINTQ
jgi:putative membrane protein